ncbi:hypothetical protein EXIGLDRAFT_723870 [Exidia glandulosa HHB12029]|uniref:Beta-glucuronidase C-terminal domain-containing protein n=1 Tax=Exidia glandulosa HHB12029 TaxID=1314781 RepID=A0A165MV24_EXIGL|nr:hypothetical protein EXIGLDRAFT_723870 [Exidia glandulosa HHB12029]
MFPASLLLLLAASATAQTTVTPSIPHSPPSTASKLDRRVASLSIEFSYLPSFGGNNSAPNELTRSLIQRIVDRTGVGPDLRPGGITVDSSVYDPSAKLGLQLVTSPTGGIYKTIFGPAYFEALNVFPNSTRVTWSVNLGNNTVGFAQAGIKAALEHIGLKSGRLFAFELGNEADHYSWGTTRPSTWASADYTSQFLGWTSYLSRNLSIPQHMFVAGGFAEDPTSAAPMTTRSIIAEGAESANTVKLYAQHTYQYSTCDPPRDAIATLEHLVDHRNITAYLDLWRPQIAAAHELGREFTVGEYNSVSCSGKQNVTDGFGQAMWLADTILYGASIGIARLHLHQGATLVFQSSNQANGPGFSWYDLWYPTESERYGAARAAPSFVAYLLLAEAVGRTDTARIALLDLGSAAPEQLAAYAIWEGPALRRVVLLNMAPRTDAGSETAVVDLKIKTATVKRMTSAGGLEEKDSTKTTWAGQSFAQGVAVGKEVVEKLEDGKVTVRGAEGVVVFLH